MLSIFMDALSRQIATFEKDSYVISAHASTSIEGNPLPLTDVRRLLKNTPAHIRDTEREILNYNRALKYLNEYIKKPRPVTLKLICSVQAMVVDGLLSEKNRGQLRNTPVVVNDPRLRKVAYIPPDVKDVRRCMDELIYFLKKEALNLDPLLLAGIFHKQFVIIHPFVDGNGRTTRLITKYLLAHMGLDTFQLFSFENFYNKNITKYFASVGVYGDYYEIAPTIDFTHWLIYFTDGIIDELLRVQKLLQNTTTPRKISDYEKVIVKIKNGQKIEIL